VIKVARGAALAAAVHSQPGAGDFGAARLDEPRDFATSPRSSSSVSRASEGRRSFENQRVTI
jgi:hypothetical protein